MILNFNAAPFFDVKLTPNVAASKAFLIQVIFPHEIEQNIVFRIWN